MLANYNAILTLALRVITMTLKRINIDWDFVAHVLSWIWNE